MIGTISFFARRGFGYVTTEEPVPQSVYFHITSVQGRSNVHEGERVQFEIIKTAKGPRAVRMEILDTAEVLNEQSQS